MESADGSTNKFNSALQKLRKKKGLLNKYFEVVPVRFRRYPCSWEWYCATQVMMRMGTRLRKPTWKTVAPVILPKANPEARSSCYCDRKNNNLEITRTTL